MSSHNYDFKSQLNTRNYFQRFYASALRHWSHYVFGLSLRPSIRLKPEITSLGSLVHPTHCDRFTASPSIRTSREVYKHFLKNTWREWPEMFNVDVSWPPSEVISLLSSVDFLLFAARSNLGYGAFLRKTHERNGLKLCMLVYLDHLQNLLHFVHGETGHIWGFRALSGECLGMTSRGVGVGIIFRVLSSSLRPFNLWLRV